VRSAVDLFACRKGPLEPGAYQPIAKLTSVLLQGVIQAGKSMSLILFASELKIQIIVVGHAVPRIGKVHRSIVNTKKGNIRPVIEGRD
jgi:hypothetical protein